MQFCIIFRAAGMHIQFQRGEGSLVVTAHILLLLAMSVRRVALIWNTFPQETDRIMLTVSLTLPCLHRRIAKQSLIAINTMTVYQCVRAGHSFNALVISNFLFRMPDVMAFNYMEDFKYNRFFIRRILF